MPLDQANWQINLTAADKTAAAFRSVEQNMKRLDSASKSAGGNVASQFGAAVTQLKQLAIAYGVVTTAQELWSRAMKAGDIGEQAEQVGLTTDQLQAYRLVAAQAGVSAEQLDGMMMKLTRAMTTAGEGSDEMIAKFDKLGVKLLDSHGNMRKQSDVLPELARGLLAMGAGAERDGLMLDFMGKSGMRAVTMLEDLAKGNDAVVAAAKKQNAVIGGETIKAWDDLDDKLKESGQVFDTFLAKFGAPIATTALDLLLMKAAALIAVGNMAKSAWDWMANGGNSSGIEATLDKIVQAQADLETLKASGASQAVLDDVQREIDKMNAELAGLNAKAHAVTFPPETVTAKREGVSNPLPKGGGSGAGTKALKQDADEVGKLLAKLQKEAERSAQTLEDQFGDGTAYAANAMRDLNAIMAQSPLAQGTYDAAVRAISDRAAEMERNFKRAEGGVAGFAAGFDQAMAEMGKANDAFAQGQMTVNLLSDTITDLVRGAEVDFGKIAASWISMLAEMEMKLALSTLWQSFGGLGGLLGGGGGGGGGGGLIGSLIGGIGGLLGFAEGGRPPVGVPSWVGERGRELFIPDQAGTIFNREQLAGMGGGTTVIVQQQLHFGSDVSRAEMGRWALEIEKNAREGAKAALLDDRRRGGTTKRVFK